MRREIAGGESSHAVTGPQLLRGVAEGCDKKTVGFVERPACIAAPTEVEVRCQGFLEGFLEVRRSASRLDGVGLFELSGSG
jgi:hypothetical protein